MTWLLQGCGRQSADPFRNFDAVWSVPVDIYEGKDGLVVKAELPGLKPEDLQVSVENGVLTIRAERKQESEVKDEDVYRQELTYGSFQRAIELPHAVNADELKATYKQGILEVTLPKREADQPKSVKIQVE